MKTSEFTKWLDDSGLVADQRFIDNFELLQELVDKATVSENATVQERINK